MTKQGIQLTTVKSLTGTEFHIVEFENHPAELFDNWDEAYTAGQFQVAAAQQ